MSASGQADMSPIKRALAEIKRLKTKLAAEQQARKEPIAIIGMGCRFPGGADSPEAFWQLLEEGGDAVRDIPSGRWDVDAFYSADPDEPGKMYTRRGAFLDPVDQFDPTFFGITPREAVSVDPQQRLLLEVIWEALEHAGRRPDSLSGSVTGVYLGAMNYDYQQLQRSQGDPEAVDGYTVTGSLFSVLGGRMSYAFGLQGPTVSVDTACSSSLVTTHLACQGLRNRECDLALAGGVNMILAPEPMIERCKAHMLATDGWCKTFDASADGYVVGEGCGIVVLKRLSDAERDGDPILAVIRGSAVNHDGPSSGLTVPNGPAQQALLKRALAAAGVAGSDIDYVEAHGTGTSLGDPIEINALNAVLGGEREHKLSVGSVKTNIGHLESAAGVAGLIKLVLALQHEELPPHLHFKEPNPLIPWNEIPVTVPTERTPWRRGDKPRLAGLSSFGVSGTNAHLVVGEAPAAKTSEDEKEAKASSLLLISSRSATALAQLTERYGSFLNRDEAPPLADVAATAALGRTPFTHRLMIAGETSADVGERLLAYVREGRRDAIVQAEAGRRPPKIAFLFSGQGSQQSGMAKGLYDQESVFREQLDRADELLSGQLGKSLKELLWEPENASLLVETGYTQPVLFALQMALVALWRSWGVEPAAVAGHSVGEIAAACTAGVLTLEEGARLAVERGRLMQSLPEGGVMAAIFAPEAAVRQVLDEQGDVTVAAVNAPRETVISGPRPAMEALLTAFREQQVKSRPLAVSHAFHSPLIEPILPELEKHAASCKLQAPRIPWVSGVTGKLAAAEDVTSSAYWTRQAREGVRFVDVVQSLATEGCQLFVEIGPGANLIALGRRTLSDQEQAVWLPSLRQNRDDRQQMLESLGALWVRGAEIDWSEAHGDDERRVAVPTSVFERKSYWFKALPKAVRRRESVDGGADVHPLLGRRLETPLDATLFDAWLSLEAQPFLGDHRLLGTALVPATATLEAALAAAEEVLGTTEPAVENVVFQETLVVPESGERRVQLVVEKQGASSVFKVFTRDDGSWSPHAGGRLARGTCGDAKVALAEAKKRCGESVEAQGFYDRLRELGLEYGNSFRGLEEIHRGDGEAVARLRPVSFAAVDPKRPHPATLDACLQLALAAGGYDHVDPTKPRVPVPFRFGRLSWSGAAAEGRLWAHAAVESSAPDAPEVRAEITLFNDDGAVLGKVEDLVVRRVEPRVLQRGVGSFKDRWLFDVDWRVKKLGPAVKTAGVEQAAGTWLIWPDAGGVAEELAALLENAGQTCVQVSADSLSSQPWQEDGRPPLRGLIFLGGLDAASEPNELEEAARACDQLLAAVQATAPGKPRVFIATRGAQAVAESAVVAPFQAALWGFGRTLARELPDLWGAAVDLDPQSVVSAAATDLFNEIWRSDGEDQIGYRGAQRHVARLVQHRGANRLPARLHPDGTYLITGGLGALGLRVARWMVDRGARHLALLGRSAPSEKAREALAGFAAEGVDAQVFAVDVASYDAVEKLFGELASGMPPLKGIVHSAGVLADGVLLQQDPARLAKVFAPKVMGSWNLHRLSAGLELDFFLLFSSMTGTLGSAGQVNYAAANAFLDALAQARQAQGLPGSSLAWGTWGESGMAAQLTDRDRQRWAASGIEPLDPEGALGVLDVAVRQRPAQLGILAVEWDAFVRKLPGDGVPPFFTEVASPPPVAAKATVQTAEAKRATKRDYWRQLAPEAARNELLDKTRRIIEEILGFPEDDDNRLDSEEDLFKTGMDSLTALEVHNELQEIMGQELSNQLLLDHTTIASIVDHLVGEIDRSEVA